MISTRISSRLRLLARGERGMALPVALFATVASVALAGAAVMSSVDVQQGSHRDNSSKSAIGAADAGANVAMMRLARDSNELADSPCLEGATPGANGWCPPVSGEVGDAAYSYQISEAGLGCGEFDLCVVATGTASGATRRVEISFNGAPSEPGSGKTKEEEEKEKEEGASGGGGGGEGLIGKEGIELEGNADIRVGVGTDGNVVSTGNSSVCGNIRHGIGKGWVKGPNATQCSGYKVTEGNSELPPVSSFIPADIATNNSNKRITTCSKGLPVECQSDTYNGKWTSTSPFKPSTRQISIAGNTTLTLGGGDYWICSLTMSGNSELIMADGAGVRVFFDTPENCGVTTQISLTGNNRIAATGYQPGEKQFDMPGFFLLGSTTTATTVNLAGNQSTTDELVVYGPNTKINVSGNATYKGVIAGKTVKVSGNGKLEQDAGFELPAGLNPWELTGSKGVEGEKEEGEPGGPTGFTAQYYVECSGVASAGQAPNANC
jgi:hypothetical protein